MGIGNMMGMMPNMNISSGNSIGPTSSNNRPSVGEASAASYEAARADHYRKMKERQSGKKRNKNSGNNNINPMNALSCTNLGMNTAMPGGGGMSAFGLSVNPNQHYEMLKLHHMNLLNEIQETTLMMNLYQQQQIQQQSQQGGGNMGFNMGGNQMGMLGNMGVNGNFMMGMNNQDGGSVGGNIMMAIPPAQNDALVGDSVESTNSSGHGGPSTGDRAAFLRKLKEDIALREKEAAVLEASLWEGELGDEESSKSNKRQKNDDPDTTAI